MATEAVFKRRHVHKFGGSSLADPVCYRRVASIVEQQVGATSWWWSPPQARPPTG